MIVARYYAGGARVVIDGVPVRLARKPSARNLADMRGAWIKVKEPREYYSADEKAKARVKDANRAIACYAAALGIHEAEARGRIECQRLRNLYHPPLDLSLEYDL